MRVFSEIGATYYCGQFQPDPTTPNLSVSDYVYRYLAQANQIVEGSATFDQYRTLVLRDTERYLFLATSHYRRALDLMVSSASHWAHVTLYYGSWFAAHALLGLFGCRLLPKHVIDVASSQIGSQRLEKRNIGGGTTQYSLTRTGLHERFWEAFYNATPRIRNMAGRQYSAVLSPVASDVAWLIKQRNRINYTAQESISFADSFTANFAKDNFPNSLPGELNTQYSICEGLLDVAYMFANQFGLATDALATVGDAGPFSSKVARSIYGAQAPELVGQTAGYRLFGIRRRPPLLSQ